MNKFLLSTVFSLIAFTASAQPDSPFQVRARAIGVVVDDLSAPSVGSEITHGESINFPELGAAYYLTDNIAADFSLTASRHRAQIFSVNDLADVTMLTPNLTAQYRFMAGSSLRPYVGAGLGYSFFVDKKLRGTTTDIRYDNDLAYVLQGGLDYNFSPEWGVNVDVRKFFVSTDVSANGSSIKADGSLDPWVFGLGITYSF